MIRMRPQTALVLFFMLACLPGSACAHKIGGFDVGMSASLGESFDDNITYVKDNKKEDFISSAKVGLEAVHEGKTGSLKVSGSILQHTFLDYVNFNNLAHDFTVDLLSELSKRDRILLSDTFSRAEEPSSFEDAFGSTAGRYSIQRNEFSLGYGREISSQYNLMARYTNAVSAYSRQDLADSYLNGFGLELGYRESSDFLLAATYDFTYRHFDPGSHATTNSLGALSRAYLTPQLYLDGNAGLSFLTSYDKNRSVKPYLGISLTDEFDQNTRLSVSFARKYDTNAYSQDFFGYWRLSSALARGLTKRLKADGSFFFGNGEYKSSDIRDKMSGAALGFTYDFTDDVKTRLSYAYSRVDSTRSNREYAKNTLSIRVALRF